MKKIISIVCAAVIGTVAFAYDVAANMPLKGSAKAMTRTDFTVISKFGDYYRTPIGKTAYKYDSFGRQSESVEFTARDVFVNKVVSVYDGAGLLTEQVCYDEENNKLWRSVIEYKDGMKADVSEFGKDGALKGKMMYAYADGKLKEETYYNGDGALLWKIFYKYNAKDQLEEEMEYFGDGTLNEQRVFAYNDAGKTDTIFTYNERGIMRSKDVFRYASDGSLSEVTTYGSDNRPEIRRIVKCDTAGNIAKLTTYFVARKFGDTVNEMTAMSEFSYIY